MAPVVQVYPNPASGSVIISSDQVIRRVECFNLTTDQIQVTVASPGINTEVSLIGLPPGFYLLQCVMQSGSRQVHKLVVH